MDINLKKEVISAGQSVWNKNKGSKITKKGLYEVWYTMVSDHEREEGYWIRYTLLCPKSTTKKQEGQRLNDYLDSLGGDGMLWLGYFNVKEPSKNYIIKKGFPLSTVEGSKNESIIKIQDAEITLDGMKGGFETKEGKKVSWDLSFSHFMEPLIVTPDIAKKLNISNTVVKSTHPNLRISGNITLDGTSKNIKDAAGIQYHTYGDGYFDPWSWLNCHTFKNAPDAYLDFGKKIIGGAATAEFFDGNESVTWWNAKLLKKLKLMKKFQFERTITSISFKVEFKGTALEAEISSPKNAIIAVEYSGPQGNNFYCYNSEVGDCKLKITKKDEEGNLIEEKEYNAEKSVCFESVFDSPQEGIKYLPWDKEEL